MLHTPSTPKSSFPNLADFSIASSLMFLCFGAILASVYLLFKPVTLALEKGAVKENNQLFVYYPMAVRSVTPEWSRLYGSLVSPKKNTTYALQQEDLNTWSYYVFKNMPKYTVENPYVQLRWAKIPNFVVNDGQLQIIQAVEVSELPQKPWMIYQVKGKPQMKNGQPILKVEASYLGSLPLHRFPYLADYIFKQYIRVVEAKYADLKKLFASLAKIQQIEGRQQKIVLKF